MATSSARITRLLEARLLESIADTPATLIHGPRQSGKTTFVKSVGEPLGYRYVTFDDDDQVVASIDDPIGFVQRLGPRAILDEVQRVPHLFTSIKAAIDRDRTPGRFIMTGSANVLMVPALADSLAGRIEILRLHPLAQAEIHGAYDAFLDDLFANNFHASRTERLGATLIEMVTTGGYPEAIARTSAGRRAAWLRAHVETQIQRDVKDLARIRSLDIEPRLLALASALTAQLLNVTTLANTLGVTRSTVDEHLTLLENIFVLDRIPAWHTNRVKRIARTPKLHVGDSGIAAALSDRDSGQLEADRPYFGHLLETFVLQELRRQASWHERRTQFSHYRDSQQVEVDIVVERGSHVVAGVEVKAAGSVNPSDFAGLRKFRAAAGGAFRCGVVLYDGNVGYRVEEDLWALPIRTLWEGQE
jgi:hypothetical protein